MSIDGAKHYVVHCWRWDREGEYNRVHPFSTPDTAGGATTRAPIEGDPTPLASWVARNAAPLATLAAGRYRVLTVDIAPREIDDAPFSHAEGWPEEDPELDVPERVRHLFAERRDTQIALLPSGALPDAMPVAYAWRAPEELALALHGAVAGKPPARTRVWAVLLQGEVRLRRAAANGAREGVVLVVPDAWVGEAERIAAALA
jgi:hypothetical protein